jgi:glycosyltransferase involved in cell wall biosynthesis
VVVAIPVRNEAERIAPCLRALAVQQYASRPGVVLLLNNCTDDTKAVVRGLAAELPITLHPIAVDLPPDEAHAGMARTLALQHAAALAGPDGVLLTTDADSVAPPDWLQRNLACIAEGADAVTGRAVIDPVEARLIPQAMHDADARECAYAALLDQIASVLDPDPADPWPRHTEESGASIAVTVPAWSRVGGMHPVPLGEDRAFVTALRRNDVRIRHEPLIWVTVSGRIEGRAAGGMADTMRRRMVAPDLFLDDRLEPARDAARRARLRRRARVLHAAQMVSALLAQDLELSVPQFEQLLGQRFFGQAWADIEQASPVLLRQRVPVTDLPQQTARARAIRARLLATMPDVAARPADRLAAVPA